MNDIETSTALSTWSALFERHCKQSESSRRLHELETTILIPIDTSCCRHAHDKSSACFSIGWRSIDTDHHKEVAMQAKCQAYSLTTLKTQSPPRWLLLCNDVLPDAFTDAFTSLNALPTCLASVARARKWMSGLCKLRHRSDKLNSKNTSLTTIQYHTDLKVSLLR